MHVTLIPYDNDSMTEHHLHLSENQLHIYENDYQCKIVYNDHDDVLGQHRKETQSMQWFALTHPMMRPILKEKDYLNSKAAIVSIGKNTFLSVNIVIGSKDANKAYGIIEKGSEMRIALVNGRNIILKSENRADSKVFPLQNQVAYNIVYKLKKDDIKSLLGKEIDKVGMMWSSGYEDYEVFNVDLIMNQLNCLLNG
ncbi:MAG TPA: hypothetical protein PKC30_13205 [Saprospiraceae bacterium]|nr:hypothetical protein [Saprospiraceae bacterium]